MKPRTVDVLLVGGGVASVRCARTLRRRGFEGSVLLVSEEEVAPYNRPPLSKELLRGEVPYELVLAEQEAWYARRGVELTLGERVVELDTGGRLARLGSGEQVAFGRCLLATGAVPRRPPLPGVEHALLLRTLPDALAIRRRATQGTRAVIVGGGFIGVEVAASLAAVGVSVAVLELAGALWGGALGDQLSVWAKQALEDVGVEVRLATAATAIEPDGVWIGEEWLPAELLVAGVGVTPRVELAAAAGLAVDDGIVTDADHATAAAGIFAAGDAARVDGLRVEHWHAAREGGERAALAMLGEPIAPAAEPWVFSEFAGQQLDVLGHAVRWDESVVLGDSNRGRFAVAHISDQHVTQLAVVNGFVDVGRARALLQGRPSVSELRRLVAEPERG